MKRNRIGNLFGAPFLIWTDLALKTGAIMQASAQVIGHRTGRMAIAGPKPSARDRREFTLMGKEKIEAAVESAQGMAAHCMTMNLRLGTRAFKQMLTGATAMMSVVASRTVRQSVERQAKLGRVMTQPPVTASQLSASAARLAHRGLRPIHARATANARRLGQR